MKRSGIFYCLSLVSLIFNVFSVPSDVEDISNEKYYPRVLQAIQEAEQSIYCCFYFISYSKSKDNEVSKLLNALCDAKDRGVGVEVILENDLSDKYGSISKKNMRTFSFLKSKNVPVFFDDVGRLTHAKYIVIDNEIVITGSFNWSEFALTRNRESAVIIKSKKIAEEYLKNYNLIPKVTPAPIKEAIPIPRDFIRDLKKASDLLSRRERYAFDLYLWFMKKSYEQKSKTIEITHEELMSDFYGKDRSFKSSSPVQRFMNSYLLKYKKRFWFVKSYKNIENKKLLVELHKENKVKDDSLFLSKLYWDDKWNKRLSRQAKFCLFIALDKTDSGRLGRHFNEEKWKLVKEYKYNHDSISNGFTELTQYNLIDKTINYKPDERNSNDYYLNDFYVYSEFEKEFESIKEKTDSELFNLSYEIIKLVNENHDLPSLKEIIGLGEEYGVETLQKVHEKIKNPENPLSMTRRYAYVRGMIRNIGRNTSPPN